MREKAKRRRGRPPMPKSERRRSNLTLRLRDEVRRWLQSSADANGRSLSAEVTARLELSLGGPVGVLFSELEMIRPEKFDA